MRNSRSLEKLDEKVSDVLNSVTLEDLVNSQNKTN